MLCVVVCGCVPWCACGVLIGCGCQCGCIVVLWCVWFGVRCCCVVWFRVCAVVCVILLSWRFVVPWCASIRCVCGHWCVGCPSPACSCGAVVVWFAYVCVSVSVCVCVVTCPFGHCCACRCGMLRAFVCVCVIVGIVVAAIVCLLVCCIVGIMARLCGWQIVWCAGSRVWCVWRVVGSGLSWLHCVCVCAF